jgi:hypothetical protein
MSDSEGPDWDAEVTKHYKEAKCEVCKEHVKERITGDYIPVGSGFWAVWYHYECKPDACDEYGDKIINMKGVMRK